MNIYVLDTFALMAYFQGEPAGAVVQTLLEQALDEQAILYASLISAGELFYMTYRKRSPARADEVWVDLRRLPVVIYPVNPTRVLAAARFKANHKVSYADAFSITLAQEIGGTVVTGDPEFKEAEAIVPVMWLP